MEIGALGNYGAHVLQRVETELRVAQETATIRHHKMAEIYALV
jgi:hypothetical protein